MKKIILLVVSLLLLTACAEGTTKTTSKQTEIPEELKGIVKDVFEQKEIAEEEDIELIATDDYIKTIYSDEEKIAFLANNSNVFAVSGMETLIIDTLSNDFKSLDDPTKTFKWALYSDSLLIDYLEQMEFNGMTRKMKKAFKQTREEFIKNIELRDEYIQAWLEYTQGKKTTYTLAEIKRNLSDSNLYSVSASYDSGLAIIVTEGIGKNDVSHFTEYGHEQINLANEVAKKMQIKYYDLHFKPLLNKAKGKIEKEDTVKEDTKDVIEEDKKVDEQQINQSAPATTVTQLDESTNNKINDLISYYLDAYTMGNTSELGYFVDASSDFYKEQINYMDSLSSRGIFLNLIDYSITNIDQPLPNRYLVSVDESYEKVTEKGTSNILQTSIYTVDKINGEFYITSMDIK